MIALVRGERISAAWLIFAALASYVEHLRRDHPGEPVMSRRDFERRRQDDREANPRARWC